MKCNYFKQDNYVLTKIVVYVYRFEPGEIYLAFHVQSTWATTCFIKRDCMSSSILKPLIPCESIDKPFCLRSGDRAPLCFFPKT